LFRGDRNFFDAFNSLERNSKRTVSAKFKLLIPMFCLVLSSANAATWYVDNTATGSHNGSSWANAWTSISQISGVSAGDSVYISGGPTGSSQTYSVSGWKPVGGTSASPITYQIGQDSAHNGTVIFSGSGNWLGGVLQNVVISGDAGDGQMHFSIANPANNTSYYGEAWSNPGASTYSSGVRISYVNLGQIPVAFDTWPIQSPGLEIDHTWTYVETGADHWGNFSTVQGTTWDNGLRIHDCIMYVPCIAGSATGCDGIQASGTGLTFYNNSIIRYTGNGINHQDGIQCLTMAYVKIYNNFFNNLGNSSIFGDNFSSPSHVHIYNNIMVSGGGGIEMGDDSGAAGPFTYTDVQVDNNLDVGTSQGSGIGTHFASTFSSCLYANNIMVDCSQITTGYTGPSSNNVTTTSANATSLFVNYVAGSTNSDFHLKSGAGSLIGQGVNLSAYFTTDYAGNTRPATGPWDIGPYIYGTNSGGGSTNPVIQVTPGSIAYGTILNGTIKTNNFTVQNIGTGTLTGTASVGAPFSIVSGGSYSLGASASQTVTVVFSPTAASSFNQSVTFTGGNGANTTVTGSATNAPVPTPVLQVTPGSIAYGTILNGTSKTNSFTVQNVGTGTLTGTASVGAPFSVVSGGSYSLGASASQTVTVVFSPTAASSFNQSVTFTGGNGANTTVTGSATNAPVPTPVLQVTPGSIAYGTILNGTSKTNSFTVQNIGTGTLTGTASVGAPFSIVSGGSYSLGASASQAVTVVFSPTVASNYNQSVTFTGGNGANTTVTGSATNAPVPTPVLQVTPGSIAYGTILNGTSKTNSFTVQNIGTGTLTGTASVGAPFSIVSGGSYSLGASASQAVTVVFSPTVASNYNQSVTFTGGSGASATVTGSATNAPPILPTVSGINENATDVDLSLPGLQIYAGTTVQYSANATNAQTWQWSYAVNGGTPVVWTNSTSPITNISCYFGTNTIGNSYVWTLVVSNSQGWAESQTNLEVEAQPLGTTNTGLVFTATNGVLSGVLMANTVINGVPSSYIYLPPPAPGYISSGTAVFNFTVANAGNYEIQALVDAPNTSANSYAVNIDTPPQDPAMIWDIMPITSGFEQRIVSWRGGGTQNNDQIVPKVFSLSAGLHQIFFKGETPGTALANFTLLQVVPAAPASVAQSIQLNSAQQPPTTPDGLRIVSP
jgi:hypothetical protein